MGIGYAVINSFMNGRDYAKTDVKVEATIEAGEPKIARLYYKKRLLAIREWPYFNVNKYKYVTTVYQTGRLTKDEVDRINNVFSWSYGDYVLIKGKFRCELKNNNTLERTKWKGTKVIHRGLIDVRSL